MVAYFLKSKGYKVYPNDFLFFSYVLLRGTIQLNKKPTFKGLKIKNPIDYLNSLSIDSTNITIKNCFIYQNYAPHDNCKRMYFQPHNAIKIDIIRQTIEAWRNTKKIDDDEYYYLLASLITAVPSVSNIAGVYGAYLKKWDPRSYKELTLTEPELTNSKYKCWAFNGDYKKVLKGLKADVLYSDSPYNSREYLPNYHILETIARYDCPVIKGVTGMRNYDNQKSEFCKKVTVHQAFESMIQCANVKYVVISYSTEGLISTEELTNICKKYAAPGTFTLKEISYSRYKSKPSNKENCLKEQIYFFRKKSSNIQNKIFNKSPMNYIGGKYKLLPQIVKFFPSKINKMADLFAGGCDVCANIEAKHIYANDINYFVIGIYKSFQSMPISELLKYIDSTIKKWGLNKTNKEAFAAFKKYYNTTKNPIDLYILMCYSFNYQFRFNGKHEYNNSFGANRSSFNNTMRNNLIEFHHSIQDIHFSSMDFRNFDTSILVAGDFLYADPPYLVTTGSYNDGKRGFNGWTANDDAALFHLLDNVNKQGAKFALSNVTQHKGRQNSNLIAWMQQYDVHNIDSNYSNSSYHSKNTDKETHEVLITNY